MYDIKTGKMLPLQNRSVMEGRDGTENRKNCRFEELSETR